MTGHTAAQVAERDQERDVRLEDAQHPHGLGNAAGSVDTQLCLLHEAGKALLGRSRKRPQEAARIAFDQAGEVRRRAEHAGEEFANRGRGHEAGEGVQPGLLAAALLKVRERTRRPRPVVDRRRGRDELMKRPPFGIAASLIL